MSILSYSMVLLIATPCCCKADQNVQMTTAAGLISSLKNYFRNECVFLLSAGQQREISKYSFTTLFFLQLDGFLMAYNLCDDGLMQSHLRFVEG